MELSGQTAVVTGAGRGIGLAIARQLADDGANVALLARTAAQVDGAAVEINEMASGRARAFPLDVRDAGSVRAAVAEAETDLGPVTLLVNNAGTGGPAGAEWEVDPEAWWECIESIVRGAFNCTQAVVPGMLSRGEGRVIDLASVTGTTAWPLVTATSLAKTALIRRVESLAAAGGQQGLKAFALHPGVVRTELLLGYRSHPDMAAFIDNAPEEVFSPPEVAAGVVARIAAGELDGLSGRFVDATADLDALVARELTEDALKLRLVQP
jgi:NAD(P)-dependent dehydrogenase (short-subunit alcohol dehydrogenase family)